MAEEKAKHTNEETSNADKKLIPPTVEDNKIVETVDDKKKAEDSAKDEQKENVETIPNTTEKKRSAAYWANWISIAAIAVNIVLILITIRLYTQAVAQSNAAMNAANAAIESNRINREAMTTNNGFYDRTLQLQEETSKSSDSVNKKTIELAEQSLQSQMRYTSIADSNFNISRKYAARSDSNYIKSINVASNSMDISKESLKKIQQNFETENKAIIFMKTFDADSIKANKFTPIKIKLQNFGKSPTILTEVLREIVLDTGIVLSNEKFRYPIRGYSFINLFMSENGMFEFSNSS